MSTPFSQAVTAVHREHNREVFALKAALWVLVHGDGVINRAAWGERDNAEFVRSIRNAQRHARMIVASFYDSIANQPLAAVVDALTEAYTEATS